MSHFPDSEAVYSRTDIESLIVFNFLLLLNQYPDGETHEADESPLGNNHRIACNILLLVVPVIPAVVETLFSATTNGIFPSKTENMRCYTCGNFLS